MRKGRHYDLLSGDLTFGFAHQIERRAASAANGMLPYRDAGAVLVLLQHCRDEGWRLLGSLSPRILETIP